MTRKWKEGHESIQQKLKEEGNTKLRAVDIGKQYLDSLKEIANE